MAGAESAESREETPQQDEISLGSANMQQQDVRPRVEVYEDGHLDVGLHLEACSEGHSSSCAALVVEPEADANTVRRELEDLQQQLECSHGFSHSEPPQPAIATIAETAANVRHIREGLDELQERLSLAYPMTDEEKLACKTPWAAPLEECAMNVPQSTSGASVGTKLSLADACAVLRTAAQREPVESSAAVHASALSTPFSLCDSAEIARSAPNRFSGEPSHLAGSVLNITDASTTLDIGEKHSMSKLLPPPSASCGAELRLATQVLRRRMQA